MPLLRCLLACVLMALTCPPALAGACGGRNQLAALPAATRDRLMAAAHAAPHAQGLLWRAERNGHEVIILGTFHLDDPRHGPILDRVRPLLAQARLLMVEAGPREQAALESAMSDQPDLVFDTTGPDLRESMAAEWPVLAAAMQARGVPEFLAAKFRPWLVSVTLSFSPCALRAQQAGARGIDHRVIDLATERGLPVAALEPYDTVFRIFGRMPEADQRDMLRLALASAAEADDSTATLAAAYFAAEPRLAWEFTRHDAHEKSGLSAAEVDAELARMERWLLSDRNRNWARAVARESARGGGPILVAVGALHLPGETGLLRLLEQRGFALTRLDGAGSVTPP